MESKPFESSRQRSCIKRTKVLATPDLASDDARSLENPDVLRRRGERHLEGIREFADRRTTTSKSVDHRSPSWICERPKQEIQFVVGVSYNVFEHVMGRRESATRSLSSRRLESLVTIRRFRLRS